MSASVKESTKIADRLGGKQVKRRQVADTQQKSRDDIVKQNREESSAAAPPNVQTEVITPLPTLTISELLRCCTQQPFTVNNSLASHTDTDCVV